MYGMKCCRGERQEGGGIVWSAYSRENEKDKKQIIPG